MRRSLVTLFGAIMAIVAVVVLSSPDVKAQQSGTYSISGTVYEYTQSNDSVPVEFALVAIPDYGIASTTDLDGNYVLKNVPKGKASIKVSYVGKVTIDKTVEVSSPMTLDFTLREENFKLKEVMVTAQASQAGGATSSIIGRNAMDHMQAMSVNDVMSLLPGGLTTEPNLSSAKSANIRNVATATAMNALGTAVIRDGVPISTNANLSAINPTTHGETSNLGGGAAAGGG